MGMAVGPGSGGVKADINVTPMCDVVLVLLIIFMVVTPMLQRGKDVKLPSAKEKKEKKEKPKEVDPLILSITPDKKVYLEQDQYDEDSLLKHLEVEVSRMPDRRLLLKGDMTLTFGDVRKVMNIARQAKAKGISLGVEEVKE
jgi:biopolymer transport protein ExbD